MELELALVELDRNGDLRPRLLAVLAAALAWLGEAISISGSIRCYRSGHYMTAQGIVARATSRELSPKERAVADFYAEHREEAAFLSAAEIAERLGTSDATVVRAVKALGYSGIPELRRELIDALRARATPAVRLGRTLDDVGERPLGHVIALEIELLERVRADRPLRLRAGRRVCSRAPTACSRSGSARPARPPTTSRCGSAAFGRDPPAITGSGLLLADELLGVRPGDVLLLMSYERLDRDADVVLRRAERAGVPVVLVPTRSGRSSPTASTSRCPRRAGARRARRRRRAVALLDALLLADRRARPCGSLAALAELNELRRQVRGAPLPGELR